MARRTKKHLKAEELELYEEMQNFEKGSAEYGMILAQWKNVVQMQKEDEDSEHVHKINWAKVVVWLIGTFGVAATYEFLSGKTENPRIIKWFEKIGMSNIIPKP